MKSPFRCWPILFSATFILVVQMGVEMADAQRNREGRGGRGGGGWDFVAKKYDSNKDGKISLEEYTRGKDAFESLDNDGDGVVTKEDWSVRSNRRRSGEAPVAGQVAPDFSLTKITDADETVTLSDFAGKKPVALLFGSCT